MKKHTEIYPEIIESWRDLYQDFWKHFEGCFHYKNTKSHAQRYIRALLARVERKNGWQMAEYLGEKSPHAIQNFLSRAAWDDEKVRKALMRYT